MSICWAPSFVDVGSDDRARRRPASRGVAADRWVFRPFVPAGFDRFRANQADPAAPPAAAPVEVELTEPVKGRTIALG